LVLGVLDALLELPAIGVGLAALDTFELALSGLQLLPRAVVVDLVGRDGIVDQRDRAVLLDLEKACAGRELANVVTLPIQVDTGRAGLQRGDQRRVSCQNADLARS